jgi:hypothetical protein
MFGVSRYFFILRRISSHVSYTGTLSDNSPSSVTLAPAVGVEVDALGVGALEEARDVTDAAFGIVDVEATDPDAAAACTAATALVFGRFGWMGIPAFSRRWKYRIALVYASHPVPLSGPVCRMKR